jgi:hypothetical protein
MRALPSLALIADVDPLAEVRVPLRAGSGAADGTTQTGASYTHSAAAYGAAAYGTATNASTGAAANASTGATPTATGAAAATTAAAAATATGFLYVLAKRGVFPIEDMKGRHTHIRDFFLAQNKLPCVVL